MKTLITDNQSLVSATGRFGHSIPVYDDGFGPLFVHRDSMGISGIVRAQTWEDAYAICEDEFFPAGDDEAAEALAEIEALPEGDERDHEQACFDEAYGYRNNTLALPDGSTSSVYAKDLNGDCLDLLTPELLAELEITLAITSPEKEEITRHAARALFASAWADYQEQSPDGQCLSGCEILDVMPQEIPAEAMTAAESLVSDVEDLNGESIDSILERAQSLPDDYADRECNAEYFGHYLAMQAMGTGVGLESVCDRDALALKLPYVEFSWHNLDPAEYPDFSEETEESDRTPGTILVSQTYEIVTPESAENGDAEDRGYEFENQEYTFRELVDLMKEHPECSSSGTGYTPTENDWFSSYPWTEDYSTGAEKSTSIHFSRENPPRLRKYWAKAARMAAGK